MSVSPLLKLGRAAVKGRRAIPLGAGAKTVGRAGESGKGILARLSKEERAKLKELLELQKSGKTLNSDQRDMLGTLQGRVKQLRAAARTQRLSGQGSLSSGYEGLTQADRAELTMSGLGAADIALFGLPIAGGMAGALATDAGEMIGVDREGDLMAGRGSYAQQSMRAFESRLQRDQQRAEENFRRLAQLNPQAAQELMVGERLPQGATVIGGEPRMDLINFIGSRMGAGSEPVDPMAGEFF